jgi:hypothetical protein
VKMPSRGWNNHVRIKTMTRVGKRAAFFVVNCVLQTIHHAHGS